MTGTLGSYEQGERARQTMFTARRYPSRGRGYKARYLRARVVRRWSRERLRRGDAVILDTETTDLFGHVVQVAVVDVERRVLLDTLVRPPLPITAAATAVHGLTNGDVVGAPQLADVAPVLLELTRGRQVLAYNADYDRHVLLDGLAAAGIDAEHLADPATWKCLMRAQADHDGRRWARLNGPHDAVGDCLATLEILRRLAGAAR